MGEVGALAPPPSLTPPPRTPTFPPSYAVTDGFLEGEIDRVREWSIEDAIDEIEDEWPCWEEGRTMDGWEDEVLETAEVNVDADDSDPKGESGRSERGGRGGSDCGVGGVRSVTGVGRGDEGMTWAQGDRMVMAWDSRGVVDSASGDGAAHSVRRVSAAQ